MMRNGGSAYAVGLKQDATRHRITGSADLLQDLIASWFSQSTADQSKLAICQSGGGLHTGRGHYDSTGKAALSEPWR